MKAFFGRAVNRALEITGHTREDIAYKVLPFFLLDLFTRYLRVKCEGSEKIPKEGPCIVIANHSGFMGFDALMLGHQIFLKMKRVPRIIAHKLWFIHPDISVHASKMGMIPATLDNGLKILEKDNILLLFPEGEEGNFKPTRLRYHLRKFRRGFVRIALKTGAPIVPALVIGAEETNITLSQIRWAKQLFGIIIPVPLNVVPLPVKWHIRFLDPIYLEKNPEKADDIAYVTKLSRQIRHQLQRELNKSLRNRNHIFL